MKKVLVFIMVLLPMLACAQVRVIAEPKQEKLIEKYDSLNNIPRFQITGMTGQELYLPPRPDYLKKYGYQDIHRTAESYTGSIPCDEIAGHTFKIVSVEEYESLIFHYKLKLEDTQTGTNYFYTYSVTQASWPFIALGYKAKYEATNKGKEFVALRIIVEKDINTGKLIDKDRGSVWTFQEIVASANDGMSYLFTNKDGDAVTINTYGIGDMKPKAEIDKLRKKYGPRMCDTAIQGNIKIGMPDVLVELAWGKPDKINRASYGEQWVYGEYGDDCVYFKNGKVTGWN
jgi:hypothetical protein